MKKIYIFRHGQTDWNVSERFQGHVDIPLNEEGRAQARALIDKLKVARVDAILSSDLSRARETGEIAARGLSIPIFFDQGLREAFLGDAQGLTFEEIKTRFGIEVTKRWGSSHRTDADVSYPGGETGAQVLERSVKAICSFLQNEGAKYQTVAISTHGGVIRRIMHSLLPEGAPPIAIPNGILYDLDYDTLSLKLLNWGPL